MQDKRSALRRYFSAKDPVRIFLFSMAVSMLIYAVVSLSLGNGRYTDIFFLNGNDLFMDFFNSIRDASVGISVYSERHVIYPPMANLIFLVFRRLLPASYGSSSWVDRLSWTEYPSAILLAVLFVAVLLLLLFMMMRESLNRGRTTRCIFALLATMSVPVLHMMDRGNIISLCLIALAVYAFTYHSKSRILREIGLLALAFAFSLKLYPALFGWFLLTDKRYKDAIRCSVYALLMLFLPCFFFGGPKCFLLLFQNTFSFSSGGSDPIASFLHIPAPLFSIFLYLITLVCAICFLLSPFVHREHYKTWLLGVLTIWAVPSLSSVYLWSFFLIPMVMMFNEFSPDRYGVCHMDKKSWVYLIAILIPFLPIPLRFFSFITNNGILTYISFIFLLFFSVIDTSIAFKHFLKERKLRDAGDAMGKLF